VLIADAPLSNGQPIAAADESDQHKRPLNVVLPAACHDCPEIMPDNTVQLIIAHAKVAKIRQFASMSGTKGSPKRGVQFRLRLPEVLGGGFSARRGSCGAYCCRLWRMAVALSTD
jgi:hypothetical protein